MKLLLPIVMILFSPACKDDLRIKVVGKTAAAVTPEVSSTIEVMTDSSGQFKPEALDGAAQYGARILDANCSKQVKDLGIQTRPEFSLPPEAYFQPLCLETTYYNLSGDVIAVKMQPISLEGPDAIEVSISKDNQTLDFPSVVDATTYTYVISDSKGAIVRTESAITDSYFDFKNSLATGDYRMIVLASQSEGKNIKAITYKLKVVITGPLTVSNLNLRFERQHYQTRSIKRLLVEQQAFDNEFSLKIGDVDINTFPIRDYTGGFGALLDSNDAFMRTSLPYDGTSVSVSLVGLTDAPSDVPVTVKDFTIFAVMPLSFATGPFEQQGLEGWTSPLQQNLIKSGDHELASTFGLMIIQ